MKNSERVTGVALLAMMAWAGPLLAPSTAQPADGGGGAVAVVVQFLGLAPEQAQALAQLLGEREAALAPIRVEVARRQQRIGELVGGGGDPSEIGRLVIEIHQLQQAAQTTQAQFLARLPSLLTDEQRRRFEQARAAAQLQPVVPAFQALSLL